MLYYYCQEGWETLKDQPIRRAGDLKPVQVVVAHLKTPFFNHMKTISFKETVKNQLIESAKKYNSLIGKRVVLVSNDFVMKKEYVIRFYETNFLHLTVVRTNLSTIDFYNKCFKGKLSFDDFDCDSNGQLKGLVRLKMRNLINIDSFFIQEIEVQEDFEKGSIKCLLGASDNKCTIGFVDAKYCVRPKTILDKNHLDKNKPIIKVTPIIK